MTASDEEGVRLEDLVNWYLKEVEAEIESVQELTDKKLLVEKVIDRLVSHVSRGNRKWSHFLDKNYFDDVFCLTLIVGSCAVAVGDGGGRRRGGV